MLCFLGQTCCIRQTGICDPYIIIVFLSLNDCRKYCGREDFFINFLIFSADHSTDKYFNADKYKDNAA